MQLFVTDPNPKVCAQNLDDRRLIKMCSEVGQVFCSAFGGAYKPTHLNHPIIKWAKSEPNAKLWIAAHWMHCLDEYNNRFSKTHKSWFALIDTLKTHDIGILQLDSCLIPDHFCNCAANSAKNLDFRSTHNVFEAYKQYLLSRYVVDTVSAKITLKPACHK